MRFSEGRGQPLEKVLFRFFHGVGPGVLDDLPRDGGPLDHGVPALDEEVDLLAVDLSGLVVFQGLHQFFHVGLLLLQKGRKGVEPGLLEGVGQQGVQLGDGLPCAVHGLHVAAISGTLAEADALPDVFRFEEAGHQQVGGFAAFGEFLFVAGHLDQ